MQLLIPYHDTLHFVQIDLFPKDADTAAKRKAVYLVRINKAPLEKALWENKDFSHTIDNTHAELRNEIFGTANAARGIFSLLMNNEPPISKVTKKDLALQLNVIDGNCRKEMQHIAYTSEIRRFRQNEDITPTPIFLKRFLSKFEEGCREVLGTTPEILVECTDSIWVSSHAHRLTYFLLFLLYTLYETHPDPKFLEVRANLEENGSTLTVSAMFTRELTETPRHAKHIPLYHPPLYTPREQAIALFCETYHVRQMKAKDGERDTYTLRFPRCEKPDFISFGSPQTEFEYDPADTFSPYHIFLAEMSNYPFY